MPCLWEFTSGVSRGGFIAATLIGIPGTNSSITTCYDAYPMSLKGQTTKALGIGMVGSFIGTFFSCIVAMFVSKYVARLAISLGPWEYFSLCVCAVSLIIALSGDNLFKGLLSAFLGMFIATVGISPIDASFRFTFGNLYLTGGIEMIAMMLGLFALKLIAVNYAKGTQKVPDIKSDARMRGLGISWADFKGGLPAIIRAYLIGMWIGFLPGLGGGIANLVAYGQEKKASKHAEAFGEGAPDGIWASEVSNNACIGGALIPMISLGIPGDNLTAILLSALMVHGIAVGPIFINDRPILFYSVFAAALIASVLTLFMQSVSMRIFPKLLLAPYHYLYASIIFICFTGAYSANFSLFNCIVVLAFGLISVLISYIGCPMAPMVLGYIITPLLEVNLRMGLTYTNQGFLPFVTRPVSGFFLLVAIVSLGFSLRDRFKGRKGKNDVMEGD